MAQPLTLAYKVTDMIADIIVHLPGGYQFWHNLPVAGRYSAQCTRKKVAHSLLAAFFPQTFVSALITACLSANGTPEAKGMSLYNWMVKYLYAGHSERLYQDWLLTQGRKE